MVPMARITVVRRLPCQRRSSKGRGADQGFVEPGFVLSRTIKIDVLRPYYFYSASAALLARACSEFLPKDLKLLKSFFCSTKNRVLIFPN